MTRDSASRPSAPARAGRPAIGSTLSLRPTTGGCSRRRPRPGPGCGASCRRSGQGRVQPGDDVGRHRSGVRRPAQPGADLDLVAEGRPAGRAAGQVVLERGQVGACGPPSGPGRGQRWPGRRGRRAARESGGRPRPAGCRCGQSGSTGPPPCAARVRRCRLVGRSSVRPPVGRRDCGVGFRAVRRCVSAPGRSRGASAARPRAQRDLTVPSGTPVIWAASATDRPCMSTRTRATRCASGSSARAWATSSRCSVAPTSSPGWGGSSSPRGVVGRAARRRTRSRQALTTIRCSHVVTAASPRKVSARRKADSSASWTASAASSRSPSVRSATDQSRSRWRRTSSPNAFGSPATWAASSSASLAAPEAGAAHRLRGVIGAGRRPLRPGSRR